MTTALDNYAELFKAAHEDVSTVKEALFGLGSAGKMRRAVSGVTDELADEYLGAMARASKGTDDVFAGGPRAVQDAITAAQQGGQAAAGAAPQQVVREGLGPLGIAGLLGLGGLGTAGGLALGQRRGREEGERKKNLAFGAGLATGAVAPRILQHAGRGLSALGGQMQQGQPLPSHLTQYRGGY